VKVPTNKQDSSKCFICLERIPLDDDKPQGKPYYLVGKVRPGAPAHVQSSIICFCEPCWIEHSGLDLEDNEDFLKRASRRYGQKTMNDKYFHTAPITGVGEK
jgi:hypothetical protein